MEFFSKSDPILRGKKKELNAYSLLTRGHMTLQSLSCGRSDFTGSWTGLLSTAGILLPFSCDSLSPGAMSESYISTQLVFFSTAK